jgi:hypothetical protein
MATRSNPPVSRIDGLPILDRFDSHGQCKPLRTPACSEDYLKADCELKHTSKTMLLQMTFVHTAAIG